MNSPSIPEGPGSVSRAPHLPAEFAALWHFAFNRLAEVNGQLVSGREEVYFGWHFATKTARHLPDYAIRHYIGTLAADPVALHASFAIYRALDATIAQNQQRKTRRLSDARAGHRRRAQLAGTGRGHDEAAADDVQTLIIPDCGHHPF